MADPAFRAIVEQFIDILPGKLDAMCAAWEQADYTELADLAHWLKGAGGTVGFGILTDVARDLESAAKTQDSERIEAALIQLIDLTGAISLDAPVEASPSEACQPM